MVLYYRHQWDFFTKFCVVMLVSRSVTPSHLPSNRVEADCWSVDCWWQWQCCHTHTALTDLYQTDQTIQTCDLCLMMFGMENWKMKYLVKASTSICRQASQTIVMCLLQELCTLHILNIVKHCVHVCYRLYYVYPSVSSPSQETVFN